MTEPEARQEYLARTDNRLTLIYNSIPVGEVSRTKKKYALRYFENVLEEEWFTPLSVGLPGAIGRQDSQHIRWWLAGLLPDRPALLMRWRKAFGVTDLEPFALLQWVGEDVAGAFQLVRAERIEAAIGGGVRLTPLTDAEIATRLAQAKADIPLTGTDGRGKFSLPGAQAKVALNRTGGEWCDPDGAAPSTHILKPAVPGYVDQDLCELMTMTAARLVGLVAAESSVMQFDDERAFVSTRYDRQYLNDVWIRIHQEDMCQAMGRDPYFKYESQGAPGAAEVVRFLSEHCTAPDVDRKRFVQALIYNWLVCGGDAHARNYSLLLVRDEVRLAPLYDLNGQLAFGDAGNTELAMSVNGKFRASLLTVRDWVASASKLLVEPDWIASEIIRQAEVLPDALATTARLDGVADAESSLPSRYVNSVAAWCASRTLA